MSILKSLLDTPEFNHLHLIKILKSAPLEIVIVLSSKLLAYCVFNYKEIE